MSAETDWGFWKWVTGGVVAVMGGLLGGGWTARGMFEGLRRANDMQDIRIAALEKNRRNATGCSGRLSMMASSGRLTCPNFATRNRWLFYRKQSR